MENRSAIPGGIEISAGKSKLESRQEALFSDKIQEALSVREGEKLPHLKIKIFYSTHNTAEDFRGFDEECKEADIIIPEALAWDQEYLDHLNRISQGEEDLPTEVQESEPGPYEPFGTHLYRVIYGIKKPITFIDVPEKNPLIEKLNGAENIGEFDNLESYIKAFKETMNQDALLQLKREQYMVDHVKERITQVLESNPSLKDKNPLEVIIQLGGFHTIFYQKMVRGGEDITRKFSKNPYVFEFQHEAERRFYFGLEVSDDLTLRALYEMNISSFFRPIISLISPDSNKLSRLLRKIVSVLTVEEIRNTLEAALSTGGQSIDIQVLVTPLLNKFDAMGIGFPKNEDELDEFLAKKI